MPKMGKMAVSFLNDVSQATCLRITVIRSMKTGKNPKF